MLCLVSQSCATLRDPVDYSQPGSSLHGESPGKNTGSVLPSPPPGDLPNSGIQPRSRAMQADSLLSEPPEKPKNTGVVSLPLLQGIFPIQESNQGLQHCRWILYQLSYQGSPKSNTIYPIFQNGYLNSCYLCLLSQAPNSDSYK